VKILVTILAYNEEANIANIIERVSNVLPDVSIAVINDGSEDDTEACARQAGVDVINLPFNLGIGGAMQTGLKLAISRGFDVVVRMDGDGQHPPEKIPDLLAPVMKSEADIAVGTRFLGGGSGSREVSFPRRAGIFFFSLLATWFSGRKVSDATCSFQAINQQAAIFLDNNMEQDHPEVDGWILLGRAGFRVKEIPMVIHPRRAGVSSINTLRALYFLVKVTITAFAAHSRKIIK
jgi:glycosyltransferase involved in cell wall biosynthesis